MCAPFVPHLCAPFVKSLTMDQLWKTCFGNVPRRHHQFASSCILHHLLWWNRPPGAWRNCGWLCLVVSTCPLVNVYIAMESYHFLWENHPPPPPPPPPHAINGKIHYK